MAHMIRVRKGHVVSGKELGTMRWQPKIENVWEIDDGPALVNHVRPEHAFVQDEVSRACRAIGMAVDRIVDKEGCLNLCRQFYDRLRRFAIGYELEQPSIEQGTQGIRTPTNIVQHRTATCIDLVCLFASLLEGAGHYPLIVVVERPGLAHVLAGYRVPNDARWVTSDLGDLRAVVARGDAVFFEATGVAQSDQPLGLETADDRRDKMLLFADAVRVAKRMLMADGMRLRHFVDVQMVRTKRASSERG